MPNLSSHIQTFSVLEAPYAGNDLIFDSLEGFYKVLSGNGTYRYGNGAWWFDVGTSSGDGVELSKSDFFPLYDYTWSKRRQLKVRILSQISNDPTSEYFFLTGNPFGPWRGFGLVFGPTKITARVGDGSDITDLDLFTGLTPGEIYTHLYEFTFYPGNGVYVNVDEAFAGAITTHLPEGELDSERLFTLIMGMYTEGEWAEIAFSRVLFSQDK